MKLAKYTAIFAILAFAILKFMRLGHAGPAIQSLLQPSSTAHFAIVVVVSLSVLGVALYVIVSKKYGDAEQKWAFGSVGTILGYWLS